jgi:lipoprotein-anchoring transpeptidase ErfK/SrfK
MSVLRAKAGVVLAAIAAVAVVAGASGAATAQGLIDFLWGGEPEYGGGRTVVKFSSAYKPGEIVVSFGDRRLYLITKPGVAISYPIAVPREQSRWEGKTTVSNKRINPDWRPTPDMIKENPKLPSWVPGGHPMNPLGVRALYLGSSTYRIHGTDAPWTIGQNVSKGCIRMFNEDVLDLYPRVPVGTKVLVTWNQFKTGEMVSADADSAVREGKDEAKADAKVEAKDEAKVEAKSEPEKASGGLFSPPPKTGFFIYPDDEANPPRPQEGMVTKYGRKVGGTVSRASQTTRVE